jgi:hypothetical protein
MSDRPGPDRAVARVPALLVVAVFVRCHLPADAVLDLGRGLRERQCLTRYGRGRNRLRARRAPSTGHGGRRGVLPERRGTRLGPVEWIAIAFPGPALDSRIAPALATLVRWGTAKLMDAVVVHRDVDGRVRITEVEDGGEDGLEEVDGLAPGHLNPV